VAGGFLRATPAEPDERLAGLARVAEQAVLAAGKVVRHRVNDAGFHMGGAGDQAEIAVRESGREITRRLEATDIPVSDVPLSFSWMVQPLDGVDNLRHHLATVGISVALIQNGQPLIGVIHAPMLGSVWVATRGGGATVSRFGGTRGTLLLATRPADRAILGTAVPTPADPAAEALHMAVLPEFRRMFAGVRRLGSASLSLAEVAAGALDGFFGTGLPLRDVAAGALLVREAGGVVCDWNGEEKGSIGGDVLAGHEAICGRLVTVTRKVLADMGSRSASTG
jgi:myo-inositol-1(or 4)-monophosphatase